MIESPSLQKLCAANAPFLWNDDLQQELNAMKAVLRKHVKLSPLDTSKGLLIWGCVMSISYGQHKLFDSEVGSLGICVRSNRVVSTDIKDPKDPRCCCHGGCKLSQRHRTY